MKNTKRMLVIFGVVVLLCGITISATAADYELTPAENSSYSVRVPKNATLIFAGYTPAGGLDFVKIIQSGEDSTEYRVCEFSVPRKYNGTMKLFALDTARRPLWTFPPIQEPDIVTPRL